ERQHRRIPGRPCAESDRTVLQLRGGQEVGEERRPWGAVEITGDDDRARRHLADRIGQGSEDLVPRCREVLRHGRRRVNAGERDAILLGRRLGWTYPRDNRGRPVLRELDYLRIAKG